MERPQINMTAGGSSKPAKAAPDDQTPEPDRFTREWWAKFWREQIRPLAIMLVCLFSVRSSLADWNVVPTGSMKPTIIEGDRIFVNKLAYDLKVPFTTIHIFQWGNPKAGEIVVFDSPKDGTRLVKRVVGVPGDIVQLIDNKLYVNGQPARYDPLDMDTQRQVQPGDVQKYAMNFARETFAGISHAVAQFGVSDHRGFPATFPPVKVPDGQYFVLGDNRDNSADSRFFMTPPGERPDPKWIGFVPRGNIVGRSSRVIISLNYDNYYIPRAQRWFRALP